MAIIPSYNRYQALRQYVINPTYTAFRNPIIAPTNSDLLNPCTVLTSSLVNQKNVIRFQNLRPARAEYLLRSKSATAISRLLTKLMNDDNYQAYYSESTRKPSYNVGVITITNFDTSINLSDYQLLVFDEDGFRISDHGSVSWYIINGTLYIVLMNCTKYVVNDPDHATLEDTWAEHVDVVFLRKIGNRDPIKIGLLEFEEGHTSVTDDIQPMETLPECLYLYTGDIDKSITSFNKYGSHCYGVALYISDYMVEEGDHYEQEGVDKVIDSEIKATIQHAIDQTGMKNWMFIDPSKYTVDNSNPEVTLVTFKNGISTIEDLDLWIYTEYTAPEETDSDISIPRTKIKIKRLSNTSKFYLYNKNTFLKTEYTYEYNPGSEEDTKPTITISRDSTTGKDAIERSFVIDRDDDDNTIIIGQYPNYIPMNWKDPNVISDDENTDAHIYSRWIDTEDVFVFIDGVKLTPYKDYIVSNTGIVGEDIPAGSIKFINRVNPDMAITFPVNATTPKHTILAFTVPSSFSEASRVAYHGPYLDNNEIIHDYLKELMTTPIYRRPFADTEGYYPVIDLGWLPERPDKIPSSMLTAENYIIFASGRFVKALNSKFTNVLDNMLCLPDLKTYNDVEYHAYFDDSMVTGILAHTWSNYTPLVENAIIFADTEDNDRTTVNDYMDNYILLSSSGRITDATSTEIKSPIDWIDCQGASMFDNWLKHNTRLVYKHDMDAQTSESQRRVPDRQTYFSANEDLALRGYKNNIRVHGGMLVPNGDGTTELTNPDMHGMPEYTASNDINNTENIEEEDTQNP